MNPLTSGSASTAPVRVMHVDLVAVAKTATREGVDALLREASGLAQLDEVVSAGVIEGAAGSDFELALLFVLRDFTALEPFGTNPRYSRFLQAYVAPVLRQLAGADVALDGEPSLMAGPAACLALAAEDETYDWEVSEALDEWLAGLNPASSAIGLAVGERQRYRGVALAFGGAAASAMKPGEQFATTLVKGKARSFS